MSNIFHSEHEKREGTLLFRHFSCFTTYKVFRKNKRKGYKLKSFLCIQGFDVVCKIGLTLHSYIK